MNPSESTTVDAQATGLLLVGHGTREAQGIDEFLATARLVSEIVGQQPVEPCFLEFAEPTIAQGFRKLAQRGARRVTVAPVLLFSAGHIQHDIPQAVAAVATEYPEIVVAQAEHLGCHLELLALSAERYQQALAGHAAVADDRTALVMVGRGSRDAQATAEMARFVTLRQQLTPVARAEAAFVAMAQPALDETLEQLAHVGCKRVIVQPHLLFGGVLLDRIGATVERFAKSHPQVEWVLTRHLGVSQRVAEAIVGRARAVAVQGGVDGRPEPDCAKK